MKTERTTRDFIMAAMHMDWQQVALNGGPPCFHLCEDGHYCGRAQRWEGHGSMHKYVPLMDLLVNFAEAPKP